MNENNVHSGERFDIPADVWAELLKSIKMIKELQGEVSAA